MPNPPRPVGAPPIAATGGKPVNPRAARPGGGKQSDYLAHMVAADKAFHSKPGGPAGAIKR